MNTETKTQNTVNTESKTEHKQVVHTWTRNRDEEVQAAWSTFKGRRYADLRIFVADDSDHLHPTKRGIAVPADQFGELEEAVAKLKAAR